MNRTQFTSLERQIIGYFGVGFAALLALAVLFAECSVQPWRAKQRRVQAELNELRLSAGLDVTLKRNESAVVPVQWQCPHSVRFLVKVPRDAPLKSNEILHPWTGLNRLSNSIPDDGQYSFFSSITNSSDLIEVTVRVYPVSQGGWSAHLALRDADDYFRALAPRSANSYGRDATVFPLNSSLQMKDIAEDADCELVADYFGERQNNAYVFDRWNDLRMPRIKLRVKHENQQPTEIVLLEYGGVR